MNIQKLMKQAQQMQEKLLQEQGALELEVSVGGGMVTIKMNGLKQLLEVQIDPEVLDPDDPELYHRRKTDKVLGHVNDISYILANNIIAFFVLYMLLFIIGAMVLGLLGLDFMSAAPRPYN